MTIFILIALALAGGVSAAAEGALPGDVLYPMKVDVNEEVRSAFAVGENQVRWDMRRVERRLAEARALAHEGALDAEARAVVATNIAKHAEAVEEGIQESADIEAEEAFELRTDFEDILRTGERNLAVSSEADVALRGEVDELAADIEAHVQALEEKILESKAYIVNTAVPGMETAAQGKQGAAEHAFLSLQEFVQVQVASTSPAQAYAKTGIDAVSRLIVQGKADVAAGDFGRAFLTFHEAVQTAAEVRRSLEEIIYEEEEGVRDDGDEKKRMGERGDAGERDADRAAEAMEADIDAELEDDIRALEGAMDAEAGVSAGASVKSR